MPEPPPQPEPEPGLAGLALGLAPGGPPAAPQAPFVQPPEVVPEPVIAQEPPPTAAPERDLFLTDLPGSLLRGVQEQGAVIEEVKALGSASEYAIARGPDVAIAMVRVLEVNDLTEEEYDALSSDDRLFAISKVLQEPFPGTSNAALQELTFRERPTKVRPLQALINVDRAGVELGAAGITGARIAAEEAIPGGGRPSLKAVREGGLGGAIERSEDVGFNIPEQVPVVGGGRVRAAEIANPLNLIPLPFIDPAVAKLLSIPLRFLSRTGGRLTAAALKKLGREAADKALDESLDATTRAALRGFSQEAEERIARASVLTPGEAAEVRGLTGVPGAARDLPTGLPARAATVEPGAAPAVRQAVPAPPARPDPITGDIELAGGTPLTRAHLQERTAANVAQGAVQQGTSAKPGRDAREAWRLWDGANKRAALHRATVKADTYDLFDDAAIKVVKDSDDQSDQVIEILERMHAGGAERGPVGQFRPGERAPIQSIYDQFDEGTVRLIVADPDFEMIALPEYFAHQFKVQKVPRGPFARGLQLRPGFLRKRKLTGALGEILDARPDLDLITWDPVAYVERHIASVDNYINSLEVIRGLKAKGHIVPEKGAPAAFRTPDIAPFRVRQTLQGWVAQPDVALTLEQMFNPSGLDKFGFLKLLKNVRESAFRVKVFGGAFQLIDYSFRDVGLGLSELVRGRPVGAVRAWASPIKAVARSVTPGLDRRLTRLADANQKLTLLYDNGLAAGVDPSISDEAIRGLGGFIPETVGGKQIPGARGLQQVIDFMGGGAYEKFHRETLEQAGLVLLEKNLKKGIPLEEAGRLAVEETNVFFSSIPNWQSAVRSKTGRDLLKFPFFATGELEGWFRLPFQAPAGFAGIIGSTVIMAEMLQKLFTGNWLTLDQLNPYEVRGETTGLKEKLPIIGKGGFNPTFLRPELPWKGPLGRTLYLDLLGQSDTPFRFALDPEFATTTRLGQFPRLGFDLAAVLHGDAPAFGEVVEGPADAARFAFQQVSPIAASGLAGTETGRIGATGAGIQSGGLNILAEGLREVLARRFEDKIGREFNPEAPTDWEEARNDPTLRPIVDAMQRYGLGSLTPREEREASGRLGAVGTEQAEQGFDAVSDRVRRGEFGDLSEDNQGRKAIWDTVGDIRTGRRAVFKASAEAFQKETERKAGRQVRTATGRALEKMDAVFDRHPNLFTEEDWSAFEADVERSLTTREQAIVERETGLGRHRLEESWHALNVGLEPYYEIPAEDATGTRARENWRQQHPQQDAQLWVLGRVSRVLTERAANIGQRLGRRAFGQAVQPSRGAPSGGGFGAPGFGGDLGGNGFKAGF